MKFLKNLIMCLCLLSPNMAFGDLVEDLTRTPAAVDEYVIDESYMSSADWNEPVFSQPGRQRDLATESVPQDLSQEVDWMGQLAVQKEIPFTYPVSRQYLEMKILKELRQKK